MRILAKDAEISVSSIQRALKSIQIIKPKKLENIKEIILLIDTTYWGRKSTSQNNTSNPISNLPNPHTKSKKAKQKAT